TWFTIFPYTTLFRSRAGRLRSPHQTNGPLRPHRHNATVEVILLHNMCTRPAPRVRHHASGTTRPAPSPGTEPRCRTPEPVRDRSADRTGGAMTTSRSTDEAAAAPRARRA